MVRTKVLYVLDNLDKGGVQSYLMNLYRNLDKNLFQIDFLVNSSNVGHFEKEITENGNRVYHIDNLLKHFFKFKREYQKVLKLNKYDIVHVHMNFLSIFPLSYSKKCVRICHAHSTYPAKSFLSNMFRTYFYHKINKVSDIRLGCSKNACKWLYNNNDFTVVNNGMDFSKFTFNVVKRREIRNELKIDDDSFVFVNVGNLVPLKRQSFLIDAFFEHYKNNKNARLLLIGDGSEKESLQNQIVDLKLEKSVLLLGSKNNVSDYLSVSDVFVLSSIYEGFPIAVIEALSNTLPCIVSASLDFSMINSNNIHYCNMESKEELISVINNSLSYKRMNCNLENFELSNTIKIIENIYINSLH